MDGYCELPSDTLGWHYRKWNWDDSISSIGGMIYNNDNYNKNYHDNLIKGSVWRSIRETLYKVVKFTYYYFEYDCKQIFYCRTHYEMKFSLLLSVTVNDTVITYHKSIDF